MSSYAVFEDIQHVILRQLEMARESVRICVAWINGNIYGAVLQRLVATGVSVELIYDDNASNAMTIATIPPEVVRYPVQARLASAFMHHKFCIIDDHVVINGSFNWSGSAPNSFENIVVTSGDYQLVKGFLHEFYDLIHFYQSSAGHVFAACPKCRSYQYTVGIFGDESGKYRESVANVWSICWKNGHVVHHGSYWEQYLHTELGLGQDEWREGGVLSREDMRREFQSELQQIARIGAYFAQRQGLPIRAFGVVAMDNFNEVNKWGAYPEHSVDFLWREMRYRKIIPSQLHEYEGEVSTLIEYCMRDGA